MLNMSRQGTRLINKYTNANVFLVCRGIFGGELFKGSLRFGTQYKL